MDKETIIEYIKKTPANTNPAVLGSMVDSVSGSGGGGADIFRVVKTVQGSTKQLDWQYDDIDQVYTANAQWLQLGQDDLTSGNVTLKDDVTITISNEETDINGKKPIVDFEVYLSNLGITIYITPTGDIALSSQTEQSIQSLTISTATVLGVSDDLALAISLIDDGGR